MAGISKEEAQKILEKMGYNVLAHLGEGAASHVFEASRKSASHPSQQKTVAAKVCCPQSNSWASLSDELNAAAELKKLKDDFKKEIRKGEEELKQKIEEAKKNKRQDLVIQLGKQLEELQKANKKILEKHFKYLTIPKLKLKCDKTGKVWTPTEGSLEKCDVAIFEAPLAGRNISYLEMILSDPKDRRYERGGG